MKRIILLGTDHVENGKCNVIELYDILLKIKPDIIFEEIPKIKKCRNILMIIQKKKDFHG
jgi:hypothetical protein